MSVGKKWVEHPNEAWVVINVYGSPYTFIDSYVPFQLQCHVQAYGSRSEAIKVFVAHNPEKLNNPTWRAYQEDGYRCRRLRMLTDQSNFTRTTFKQELEADYARRAACEAEIEDAEMYSRR